MTEHPPSQTPGAVRLTTADDLADPAALAGVLGPVTELRREPMATGGHSVSTFERLDVRLRSGERVPLVLKRVRLALDWGARRTGDTTGREAAPLAEPALAGIWGAFRCPYRAYAFDDGEVGLLMDDLSPYLLPDADARVDEAHEDALLAALAAPPRPLLGLPGPGPAGARPAGAGPGRVPPGGAGRGGPAAGAPSPSSSGCARGGPRPYGASRRRSGTCCAAPPRPSPASRRASPAPCATPTPGSTTSPSTPTGRWRRSTSPASARGRRPWTSACT